MTSSGFSPTLARTIAMAMIVAGRSRFDEVVAADVDGRRVRAHIAPLSFYDPENTRLKD